MAQHTGDDDVRLSFAGMRGKTYEHQVQAIQAGYSSTAEMAIDLLAERLLAVENRLDALDGGREVVVVPEEDSDGE